MGNDNRANIWIRADNLSAENNIDEFSSIHGAYIVWIQELIVENRQVVIYLTLVDHVLHEIFHGWRILMINLHMLRFVVNNICIEVCQFIFCQGVLVIQIHKNGRRNQFILLQIHRTDVALIQSDELQGLEDSCSVESMIFMIQHIAGNQHRTNRGKNLQVLRFLTG